jgi:hypothetical protein
MKEKQIEQNIREQMLALESQMKRLQKWRDTGYSAMVCADDMHNWVEKDRLLMNSDAIGIIHTCRVCGIEKFSKHVLESEQFSDVWLEFREGGEEE